MDDKTIPSPPKNDGSSPGKKQMHPRRKTKPAVDEVSAGLRDEIRMLRALIRQAMDMADEGRPLGEMLDILDTLSKSSTRLGTLLKTEKTLVGSEDANAALLQALSEVRREMGL